MPLEEMERNLGIELSEDDVSGAQSGTARPLTAAWPHRCDERSTTPRPGCRVPLMTIADRPRVDLREVLRTTCAASPVEAIARRSADGLGTLIGATDVQFLITNVTHRAVVRRSPVPGPTRPR